MGAGSPANEASRCMAPALPVFAAKTAPTVVWRRRWRSWKKNRPDCAFYAGTFCRCFKLAHQRFIGHLVPVTRKCGA
ncbi:hypothetical protein C6A77_12330 [Pseudomonas sp. AFG_SD02_1510_Pfu_092]|nr:hypothetical protein C6A77_12330 [Pseudomonas sp. AFG_SD02_1510_Pfu_092]